MKRIALLAALFVALVGQAGGALAQYPVRSIRIVIPFGPGSATDSVMRVLALTCRPAWVSRSSSTRSPAPTAPSPRARSPDRHPMAIRSASAAAGRSRRFRRCARTRPMT